MMFNVGIQSLARATYDAAFNEMYGPHNHAMSVVLGCLGAELLMKSAIAEVHPLIIFNNLAHYTPKKDHTLCIDDLIISGRTVQFSELPNILWAVTDYVIDEIEVFEKYRKLRNTIVHFHVSHDELSSATLNFAYKVMQPMINHFWGDIQLIDFMYIYDTEVAYYIESTLRAEGLLSYYKRPEGVREENLYD